MTGEERGWLTLAGSRHLARLYTHWLVEGAERLQLRLRATLTCEASRRGCGEEAREADARWRARRVYPPPRAESSQGPTRNTTSSHPLAPIHPSSSLVTTFIFHDTQRSKGGTAFTL